MHREPNLDALRERAARLVTRGRMEDAELVLHDLLERAPEDPFALSKLGHIMDRAVNPGYDSGAMSGATPTGSTNEGRRP